MSSPFLYLIINHVWHALNMKVCDAFLEKLNSICVEVKHENASLTDEMRRVVWTRINKNKQTEN